MKSSRGSNGIRGLTPLGLLVLMLVIAIGSGSGCGGSSGSGSSGGDVTDGLVAAYTCSGDVNDSGGSAHGTEIGGFTYEIDRLGNTDSACSFDGIDAKVTVSTAIGGPGGAGFSISFWAKTGLSTFSGSLIYGTSLFSFNDSLNFTVIPGATKTASSSVPQNVWTHFVGTYDDTTQLITIYRDGVQEEQATKGTPVGGLSILSLDLGQNSWPAADFWTGALDEIRLYKRALSDAEVKQLYDFQLDNWTAYE